MLEFKGQTLWSFFPSTKKVLNMSINLTKILQNLKVLFYVPLLHPLFFQPFSIVGLFLGQVTQADPGSIQFFSFIAIDQRVLMPAIMIC